MARGKHISQFCNHCERTTRMEMIGAVESQPEKTWYRCTRCRHATLVDIVELKRTQDEGKKKLDKANCSEYRPENTYSIGQAIFHSGWDDIGKIVSKVRTSGGTSAIIVSFEKLGERRLVESVVNNPDQGSQIE